MSVETMSWGAIDKGWEGTVLSVGLLSKELTQCRVEGAGWQPLVTQCVPFNTYEFVICATFTTYYFWSMINQGWLKL